MIEKLDGEGNIRIVTEIRKRRACQYEDGCENFATKKITFLLNNARNNPASSGYGRDDISWRSDAETFSCDDHENCMRSHPPFGMDWCATYDLKRFPHMALTWEQVSVEEKK